MGNKIKSIGWRRTCKYRKCGIWGWKPKIQSITKSWYYQKFQEYNFDVEFGTKSIAKKTDIAGKFLASSYSLNLENVKEVI